MALLPSARVAVRLALANYLRTNMQAAWPNLVVTENWPNPQKAFPPQALTVLAPVAGQVIEYHQPVVWQVNSPAGASGTILYSYGKMEIPLELDVWAQFESVRDDLASTLLPLLNQNPDITLATGANASLALAPGLVLFIPTYSNVTAEYRFDPVPNAIETSEGATVSDWRYIWRGNATIYLMQSETQPLMKDVTILLGANGSTPERISYTYEGQVLADAPLLYWRMGDLPAATTTVDIAGSSHTGALTSSANVTFGSAGLVAIGTMTNDVNTSAAASSALPSVKTTDVLPISSTFTVEWWMKPTTITAGGNDIGQSAATFKVSQNVDGSAAVSVGNNSFSVPGVYVVGRVTHCALTYDGTNSRFYLNGQLATTSATAAPSGAINSFGFAQVGPWQCSVQEIALYPTALSAARVLNHYFTGLNGP
jgi:hypothetical protein